LQKQFWIGSSFLFGDVQTALQKRTPRL